MESFIRRVGRFFQNIRACLTNTDFNEEFEDAYDYFYQDTISQGGNVQLMKYQTIDDVPNQIVSSSAKEPQKEDSKISSLEKATPNYSLNDKTNDDKRDSSEGVVKLEDSNADHSTNTSKVSEFLNSPNEAHKVHNQIEDGAYENYPKLDDNSKIEDVKLELKDSEMNLTDKAKENQIIEENLEKEATGDSSNIKVPMCIKDDITVSEDDFANDESEEINFIHKETLEVIPAQQSEHLTEDFTEVMDDVIIRELVQKAKDMKAQQTPCYESLQNIGKMTESEFKTSSEPSKTVKATKDKAFNAMDIFLKQGEEQTLGPVTENPDIVVHIGKEHRYSVTKKMMRFHSQRFYACLLLDMDPFRQGLIADPEFVSPIAFETILRFVYFKEPIRRLNSNYEVVTAAIYLEMHKMLDKLQNFFDEKTVSVRKTLTKFVLASEMKAHLENSPIVATHKNKAQQIIIKGHKGDLKKKHIRRLRNPQYIEAQTERTLESLFSSEGDVFEQIALKPHVVVDKGENITLILCNVFHYNYKEAIYIDVETYVNGIENSMRLSVQILALRFEKLVLRNEYLKLNKAQMEILLQQDILKARSEVLVFLAALKWLNFDFERRSKFSEDLMNCVCFEQMTEEEVLACQQPPVLKEIVQMPVIKDMLHNALMSAKQEEIGKQENLPKSVDFKPRTLLLKGEPLILWDHHSLDCVATHFSQLKSAEPKSEERLSLHKKF
ncbi:hypothetical protein JTE90_023326 [Oedothorax gibbosus]|uniref:BACK domain-containing protein n=1 Tax=Oedothorax gibbosus TaxID=931172 RepID=A0AAV6VEY4_9ARAC|nr:hypothetical protein JTE90_023326 [Oedothorax gibbosus]